MKKTFFACALAVCVAAAGCVGYESKTTVPTSPTGSNGGADTVASMMGSWQSTASNGIVPSPSSCTDFKWNPTEQTATSAKGSFSASCAGDLKVSGSAMATLNSGTLNAGTVTWSASGTASTPAIPSCSITLTGTAELGVNSIRIPYTGTTCLGPVSGVEVLAKK